MGNLLSELGPEANLSSATYSDIFHHYTSLTRQNFPGFYDVESSLYQSTSTLNEDIKEETEDPSIRSSMEDDQEYEDFQQYYQQIRKDNIDLKKKKVQSQSKINDEYLYQMLMHINNQQKHNR